MKIKILTLFPNMFSGFISESIIKRSIDKGVVEIELIDYREYSNDKHNHVDDTPCGGGAGMVIKCDVIDRALEANKTDKSYVCLMTPQGKPYKQEMAYELAKKDEIILICGHYEGFDERVRSMVDDEISVGDFVLTGGEIPAMAVSDSIIRLLDDAITTESHEDDSFSYGLLEYPQYTRPVEYKGMKVPEVLLNGNHKLIREFHLKEALRKTYLRRPDLLENRDFTKEELKMLEEIKKEEA
ncbi:MAG: tRNA (guanosine(37)-N1)-methyltransferase TrmD [Acholeplasmatales bacterium]|nr:tRNA (guanosine(37)-N1)-methyltransferase TrmD [Acholeplasmatales bacterium]